MAGRELRRARGTAELVTNVEDRERGEVGGQLVDRDQWATHAPTICGPRRRSELLAVLRDEARPVRIGLALVAAGIRLESRLVVRIREHEQLSLEDQKLSRIRDR